jgi:uncharacterized protein
MAVTTTASSQRVVIPQYSKARVLGVWAMAALPMGFLAWVVAPVVATFLDGPMPLIRTLIPALTLGLAWQFALVVWLVRREQGTLRWSVVREALWLRAPQSPAGDRRGGRLWWVLVPMTLAFAAEELLPEIPHPASHAFGEILDSPAGRELLGGNLLWPAVVIVMMVLNTVLGEELLFRGLLLPRMGGAFGRADWFVNGVLFAAYHLHQPWSMTSAFWDTFILAFPSRRYRSALLGIIVHSTQTVFLLVAVTALVVG